MLMVGVIVSDDGDTVSVQIPRLSGEAVIENVECVNSGFDANPVKGERVIIGFLEGVPDSPLVLGRVNSSFAKKGLSRNPLIKGLADRVETLEEQVETLQNQVDDLLSRVAALESA